MVEESELSQAAVAVLVGSDPDAVLLIRRSERDGDPWSGHMGLPGGRRGPTDEHLLATAIRETMEEVGVEILPHQLLGTLDDVAPKSKPVLPVFARPFVFAAQGHPVLRPNHEVSTARWVPLQALTDPLNVRQFSVQIGGTSRTFPSYHLVEGPVWGMTERILTSLIYIIGEPTS